MALKVSRVIRRFVHYGPLLATFIIVLVTIMTLTCIMVSTPITSFKLPNGRPSWQHHMTLGSFINMTVFLCFAILTSFHFLACMIHGPGYVKNNWKPEVKDIESKLQFCQECEGFKCPRSHHCRKCKRCVKRMDHHCPWINACVGHKNHAHFIRFLFYAASGCFYGGTNLAATVVKIIFYGSKNFIIAYYFNSLPKFVILVFSCGIAYGVSLAVGFLLVMQLRDISKNTTSIESWIIRKAEWRHSHLGTTFTYPYHLGSRWNNLTQVINMSNFAKGDGYTWPVVPGTDQYTFTEEQIQQKLLKRQRMVDHVITGPYVTNWFSRLTLANPLLFCVCNGLDEQYIAVNKGDKVLVSRWRKRWLYGCIKRKLKNKDGKLVEKEIGGWFPRICAMETAEQTQKKVE
ncbi:palmitoyltransferase ZDHHC6-like isoform X2 [Bolinopsis microptera]|uniref:palmitoyltransferase ZDHHC6-like isoform X1 n=1 Tax=Bolinopsis microptera TaxID=2820187 RepID=UPI00307AAD79